ncbi:MAG: GNAT family N-acetyltransferase [Parvularculaceae bacterium]
MQGDGAQGVHSARRAPSHGDALVTPADALHLTGEWRDLAENAVEANPFYSPALLLPALAHFPDDDPRVAVIRNEGGLLIGLAPVAPLRGYSRLPVRYMATWMHPHCFFAAPIVRSGYEPEFFRRLYALLDDKGAFLRLRHLDSDGLLFAAAISAVHETGRLASASARYGRAMLGSGWRTDAYLEGSLDGKKRKELRRLRNRLEEIGPVRFETLAATADVARWIDDFLALEAAGWKGREGTALASEGPSAAFFRDAIAGAHDAGALRFHRLSAGAATLAMIVNFIEQGQGFSFKIAHDETYARFSPGVMIEIEMMKALEAEGGISFIDSCAQADHPMIDRLWRERRTLSALNISRRDAPSKAMFHVLMTLERASEAARKRKAQTRKAQIPKDSDDDL